MFQASDVCGACVCGACVCLCVLNLIMNNNAYCKKIFFIELKMMRNVKPN